MRLSSLVLRLTGAGLIALGFYVGWLMLRPQPGLGDLLERLPDHDYCAEARRLAARGEYAEAKALCEDIISCGLPGDRPARILRDICDERMNSFRLRVRNAVTAFVTGDPRNSAEEAGAAMLSDMLMYGDIRDLAVQGSRRLAGQPADPLIAALAAAGLLTEFVDAADWAPALFKLLRRASVISDKLAANLFLRTARGGRTTLRLRPAGRGIVELFRRSGYVRTKNILRGIDTAEDASVVVRISRRSVPAAHLLARSAGKNTASAARKLFETGIPRPFLLRVVRKGPAGVTLLLRGAKAVRKGSAGLFLERASISATEKWGRKALVFPAAAALAGALLVAASFAGQALLFFLKKRFFGGKSPFPGSPAL
ncbi:MAG: hypothetical protein IJS01_13155 [Lentisphaeria bacterium]|nr:hypothetical protein [Lentisphaeria bacterium]